MFPFDDQSIYGLLHRIMRVNFIRSHELFEKHHVHPGQPPLLISLYMLDGQSQAQLAQALQVKPSTVTMMIRRLQKAELIYRVTDAHDKRISRIFLTDTGRLLSAELIKINSANEVLCTESMTPEEKVILRRLLMQVLDNLSQPLTIPNEGEDYPC